MYALRLIHFVFRRILLCTILQELVALYTVLSNIEALLVLSNAKIIISNNVTTTNKFLIGFRLKEVQFHLSIDLLQNFNLLKFSRNWKLLICADTKAK